MIVHAALEPIADELPDQDAAKGVDVAVPEDDENGLAPSL